MKVIEGGFKPTINADIVAELRRVADRIERGEIDTVVLVYLADDHYEVSQSCSPRDGVVMATMLHRAAANRLYEGPQ